ncbi:hypothetical protein PFLUV_G00089270 [Perca fluviatilis]|uniref:Uncharacterized protein n=1 Tax=Perca fluviatilis TaxID=8168 RepID=A0A6A5FAD6_PERFL|nr:hypothetical protein PFLUV_G00089270 [Perca fluviatilis]
MVSAGGEMGVEEGAVSPSKRDVVVSKKGRRGEEGAALSFYVSGHHRGTQDLFASGTRGDSLHGPKRKEKRIPLTLKRADLPTIKDLVTERTLAKVQQQQQLSAAEQGAVHGAEFIS